jgi:TonB family protein
VKPEQVEEPGLHFLLEEYDKRFQQPSGDSSPQTGTPTAPSPRRVPPAELGGLELDVLLENYSFVRKGWLPEYRRAQSGQAKNRTAPAAAPPVETALLQLLVEEYAPAEKFWQDFRRDSTQATLSKPVTVGNPDREPGPDLLLDWDTTPAANWRRAGLGSLAIHAVSMLLLLIGPFGRSNSFELRRQVIRPSATLFAPSPAELAELTQPDPSKGPATLFSGPAEEARPLLVIPETQESPEPPKPEEPEPAESVEPEVPEPEPPEVEPQAPTQPEPPETAEPKVEIPAARSPNPGELRPNTSLARIRRPNELPAPRAPRVSKPKLVLENPSATSPGREGPMQLGSLKLSARTGDITEGALRQMREGTSGRPRVGDGFGTGGLGGYLPPSPGNTGSNLELMSDPKGIDFRPYLIQVLAAVRRNWHAVIPESARLGINRGRVAIQFAISKTGSVPKLVIASSSGVNSLDRAAVAGISASNPFPALPREFTGETIRLQFAFQYNQKKSTVGGL